MQENKFKQANAHAQIIEIWDLPIRVFHWTLIALILSAYITGEQGGALMDWHGRIGGAILFLITFRIIWGLIGSPYAKFSHFFPTINRLKKYFQGKWSEEGHNPLGAISVIVLLLLILMLVITGLFSNDDIAFNGPWYGFISKETSDFLSGQHHRFFDVLVYFIFLHIAAILFYVLVKKQNLIAPMVTGKKKLQRNVTSKHKPLNPKKLLVALSIAAFIVWLTFSEVIHQLHPNAVEPPPASTANW